MKWVYYAKITFENFCTSFGIFVPDVTHTVLQSLWLSSSTAFMQKNVFTSLIILQTMHPFFSIKNHWHFCARCHSYCFTVSLALKFNSLHAKKCLHFFNNYASIFFQLKILIDSSNCGYDFQKRRFLIS